MALISRKVGSKFLDGDLVLRVRKSGGNPVNPCYGCRYDSSHEESCKNSRQVHGECTDDGGKIFVECTWVGSWLYRVFGI